MAETSLSTSSDAIASEQKPNRLSQLRTITTCLDRMVFDILSTVHRVCGRSSMAEHEPSKLETRVRFPSPAPPRRPGWRNGSRSRLKICRTRVRAGSSPAPGTKAEPAWSKRTKTTTGEVSEWSMVQPWKGCVGASPPGVRIPPPPPAH